MGVGRGELALGPGPMSYACEEVHKSTLRPYISPSGTNALSLETHYIYWVEREGGGNGGGGHGVGPPPAIINVDSSGHRLFTPL